MSLTVAMQNSVQLCTIPTGVKIHSLGHATITFSTHAHCFSEANKLPVRQMNALDMAQETVQY